MVSASCEAAIARGCGSGAGTLSRRRSSFPVENCSTSVSADPCATRSMIQSVPSCPDAHAIGSISWGNAGIRQSARFICGSPVVTTLPLPSQTTVAVSLAGSCTVRKGTPFSTASAVIFAMCSGWSSLTQSLKKKPIPSTTNSPTT